MKVWADLHQGYGETRYRAYLSEPITRCPQREKGRIQTLVSKMSEALDGEPFYTSLYIPSLVTSPEKRAHMSPEHVYLLDRIRIIQADYLLVIADHTSFGIGGEVEMATSLGKPILFLSREDKVSRFLLGTPVNALRAEGKNAPFYIQYRDWRDLKPRLLPAIQKILKRLDRHDLYQLPFWDVSQNLAALRLAKGWDEAELARRAGLHEQQIRLWERSLDQIREELECYRFDDGVGIGAIVMNHRQLEQLANPGLDAIHRLAYVLDVPVHRLVGEEGHAEIVKGPGKALNQMLRQIQEARQDSLQARADQFDITYREFLKLKTHLVDYVIEQIESGKLAPNRFLNLISETEFLDALRKIRHRS